MFNNFEKPSPLKVFVLAKKDISLIYNDVSNYLNNILKFSEDVNFLTHQNDYINKLKELELKVSGIKDILLRDHMKVAFFGRTSNGKSTVINSMLGERVLPSGIGHTTSCFVQVEGYGDVLDKELEPYSYVEGEFEKDGKIVRQSITSVEQLANALTSDNLSQDSLVHVCWPKYRCTMLRDDVVLVDSPGIDVSPDVDKWIDSHCQDADVFVLVANAESTLMQTEKNFFHNVATKFSAPNIFVLNNRWDASSNFDQEIIKKVKKQHTERVVNFLTTELSVMTEKETPDRIFFISAKEALEKRLLQNSSNTNSPMLSELKKKNLDRNEISDVDARWNEFLRFETKFEECISRSAIKTKFEKHTLKAKEICEIFGAILSEQLHNLVTERESLVARGVKNQQRLRTLEHGLQSKINLFEHRADKLGDIVKQQVRLALDIEIKRLGILVDEFDWKGNNDYKKAAFSDPKLNREYLSRYKTDLEQFVEEGLSRNLTSRCLADTLEYLYKFKHDLNECFREIVRLNSDAVASDNNNASTRNTDTIKSANKFDLFGTTIMSTVNDAVDGNTVLSPDTNAILRMAFHLDCKDLWRDFHENLDFKFSLSPARLIKRALIPFLKGEPGTYPKKMTSTSKRSERTPKSTTTLGRLEYTSDNDFSKNKTGPAGKSTAGFAGDNTPVGDRPDNKGMFDSNDFQVRRSSLPTTEDHITNINNNFEHPQKLGFHMDNTACSSSSRSVSPTTHQRDDQDEDDSLPFSNELKNLSLIMAAGSMTGISSLSTSILGTFLAWKVISSFLFSSSYGHGGHGTFEGPSLLFKALMMGSLTYGGLYVYERLAWTAKSKEKLFKSQFVLHGVRHLRLVASRAAINCASHVKADASRSLHRFESIANAHKKSLEISARSDYDRRETCDQLIADRYPLLEANGSRLAQSVESFLSTYFMA